jgi:hypothetical protein
LLLNKQNKVHPIPIKIPIDIPMSRPLIAHPVGSALLEVDYLQYTRIDIVFSLQLAFGLWGSFNPAARAWDLGLPIFQNHSVLETRADARRPQEE